MRDGRVLGLFSFVKRRLGADPIAKTFHTAHPRRYMVIECGGITKIPKNLPYIPVPFPLYKITQIVFLSPSQMMQRSRLQTCRCFPRFLQLPCWRTECRGELLIMLSRNLDKSKGLRNVRSLRLVGKSGTRKS